MLKNNKIRITFHFLSKFNEKFLNFFLKNLKILNLKFKIFFLPKVIKKLTLIKSPHVDKKSREQFEIIKRKCIIDVHSDFNKIPITYFLLNKPKTIKMTFRKII